MTAQEHFETFIATVMKLLDATSTAGREPPNDIAARKFHELSRAYEELRVGVEVSPEEIERGVRAMLFDDDTHDAWMAAVEWADGPAKDENTRLYIENAYNAWCVRRYPEPPEDETSGGEDTAH